MLRKTLSLAGATILTTLAVVAEVHAYGACHAAGGARGGYVAGGERGGYVAGGERGGYAAGGYRAEDYRDGGYHYGDYHSYDAARGGYYRR